MSAASWQVLDHFGELRALELVSRSQMPDGILALGENDVTSFEGANALLGRGRLVLGPVGIVGYCTWP